MRMRGLEPPRDCSHGDLNAARLQFRHIRGCRQPSAPARLCYPSRSLWPPWSRGLGRRPLTAKTGVRIPLAVLQKGPMTSGLSSFRGPRRGGLSLGSPASSVLMPKRQIFRHVTDEPEPSFLASCRRHRLLSRSACSPRGSRCRPPLLPGSWTPCWAGGRCTRAPASSCTTCRARATTARSAPRRVPTPTTRRGSRASCSARRCASTATTTSASRTRRRWSPSSSRSRHGFAASGSPGTYRYIVGKGAKGCESSSYGLFTSYNGGMRFYVTDTDRRARATSGLVDPGAIWNGKWHHVAGTFDGATAKLFVDGKLIPSPTGASAHHRLQHADDRRRSASAASSAPATCSTRATSTTWRSSARRCRSTSTGRRCRSCSPSRCGRSTPRPWRRLRRRHPTGREPSGAVRRASFTPDRSCLGDRGPGRGRASPARGRDEALKRRQRRPEPVRQISARRA